jgi:hypothetical protein
LSADGKACATTFQHDLANLFFGAGAEVEAGLRSNTSSGIVAQRAFCLDFVRIDPLVESTRDALLH